jgi:hypothetical protein
MRKRAVSNLIGVLCVPASIVLLTETGSGQSVELRTGRVPDIEASRQAVPQAWGTTAQTIHQITASGCSPAFSDTLLQEQNGYRYKTAGTGVVDCSLNLPTGAIVDRYEVLVHDSSDAGNVVTVFTQCVSPNIMTGCTGWGTANSTGTAATPSTVYIGGDVNLVVNKFTEAYEVRIVLNDIFQANMFRQVNVYYRLQVSPAPGAAAFFDVAVAHPYFRFIEALAAAGITSGCGAGNYCPDRNVTRGEMAVFLAKALGLHFPN